MNYYYRCNIALIYNRQEKISTSFQTDICRVSYQQNFNLDVRQNFNHYRQYAVCLRTHACMHDYIHCCLHKKNVCTHTYLDTTYIHTLVHNFTHNVCADIYHNYYRVYLCSCKQVVPTCVHEHRTSIAYLPFYITLHIYNCLYTYNTYMNIQSRTQIHKA